MLLTPRLLLLFSLRFIFTMPLFLARSTLIPIFFFTDSSTAEIYTLSLHDALPISGDRATASWRGSRAARPSAPAPSGCRRSEEHTPELQSQFHLVCRLLLEKKKTIINRR